MDDYSENTFVIRPNFQEKFRPSVVQQIIHDVLQSYLGDKTYDSEAALQWTQEICDEVKQKLKELKLPRYKFVVQGTIGEQRGEGVKVGARCLWDSDTDNLAQDVYVNDSLFCVVAAYGVYYY
ncbi:Tctex1 domain-containing protein 2 [Salpingoeca rosetta]|uniref:Tctex1 domain-containing protein 2 n=1 Tax=Salpingoeca rosetta (strain ATCC 50818 / BSB-021) TaxID=946362 RepID=F2U6L1_SALR5|nr:Tctex1 domain-containing protein 2 [Salpingoeca rosetta]EGD83493.1 Tctex1 domain-containing protein 2 [Salpingoeca rosetta]|eukprot:XP_004994997.1 Tctex1 domain-containing protein 2 [Salpingoeca rosetta]